MKQITINILKILTIMGFLVIVGALIYSIAVDCREAFKVVAVGGAVYLMSGMTVELLERR